jgi:protein phosphatase methylesterase 1
LLFKCNLYRYNAVEGTAMAALPRMAATVAAQGSAASSRPARFPSMRRAVQWAVRAAGGSTRNLEAARVSFPSQLVPMSGDGRDGRDRGGGGGGGGGRYRWRTDLAATQSFWSGWQGCTSWISSCDP